MLKRTMYGRARVDLPRARMIPLSPIQNHTNGSGASCVTAAVFLASVLPIGAGNAVM